MGCFFSPRPPPPKRHNKNPSTTCSSASPPRRILELFSHWNAKDNLLRGVPDEPRKTTQINNKRHRRNTICLFDMEPYRVFPFRTVFFLLQGFWSISVSKSVQMRRRITRDWSERQLRFRTLASQNRTKTRFSLSGESLFLLFLHFVVLTGEKKFTPHKKILENIPQISHLLQSTPFSHLPKFKCQKTAKRKKNVPLPNGASTPHKNKRKDV